MEETGYQDMESHRKVHVDLLVELNGMIAKVNSEREFPEDLLYFLNRWLIEHIEGQTSKLRRTQGVASNDPSPSCSA